jgi:hypothetical protein
MTVVPMPLAKSKDSAVHEQGVHPPAGAAAVALKPQLR